MSSTNLKFIEETPGPVQPIKTPSPARLLTILVILIFLAELVTMAFLYYLQLSNYAAESLLDGLIMLTLILPGLYFLQLKPLLQQVEERSRADQALRASETLLRQVLELLPVGVWITDKSGKIIHGNPASLDIWGGAKHVGADQYREYKGWWLDSGKRIQPTEWAVSRALNTGEISLNEEIKIECFDGSEKVILNSSVPIYTQGAIQGAIIVNQDITQRFQSERALLVSNQIIERIFNNIDTLIVYMDRDYNFIRVNETYARRGGHPVDFFNGKNHFDLYPNEEDEAIFRQVVETGEPVSIFEKPFEYTEFPERGMTYWNWSLQPIKDADGTVQGLILSLLDVTARKQAQLQLEKQNEELQALSMAEQKLRELSESLVQSTLALNTSLNLEDLLEKIMEQVRRAIPFHSACIALLEENTPRMVHYHWNARNMEMKGNFEKSYPMEAFAQFQKIFSTQQPVLVADTNEALDWQVAPDMEGVQSYIAAPLIISGRVMGILSLASDQPGAYTQETIGRLVVFTAPAAVAVQNAQLYTAELHSHQLAETLSAVSLALTQTLDIETVINTLLEFVCNLIPCDNAYISISENESRLTVRAAYGDELGADQNQAINPSVDIWEYPYLKKVFDTRKSLQIADTRQYPGWTSFYDGKGIRNWLGVPMVVGDKAIGLLVMGNCEPEIYTSKHIRIAEGIVTQASVAIQNAWLFEQVRAGHERLQSLSRRLVEVQESERRYVARELHDEASQALTALIFGLSHLEQEIFKPQTLRLRITELKQLTEKILEELHNLAVDLRPASLDHLGLVGTLEELIKGTSKRYNLKIRFRTTGFSEETRLPDYVETTLYRIIQEALTNAVRHARANNVDVILDGRDGRTVVMVEDDGIGFDTGTTRESGHLGLLGMQERAQMVGGTLQVESRTGGGTTIVLEVPGANSNFDLR